MSQAFAHPCTVARVCHTQSKRRKSVLSSPTPLCDARNTRDHWAKASCAQRAYVDVRCVAARGVVVAVRPRWRVPTTVPPPSPCCTTRTHASYARAHAPSCSVYVFTSCVRVRARVMHALWCTLRVCGAGARDRARTASALTLSSIVVSLSRQQHDRGSTHHRTYHTHAHTHVSLLVASARMCVCRTVSRAHTPRSAHSRTCSGMPIHDMCAHAKHRIVFSVCF